jgi:site-specific DNA recombinase
VAVIIIVIIICRISDENQTDGYSLDEQERICINYCIKNNIPLTNVKIFKFQESASKHALRNEWAKVIKEAWLLPSKTILVAEKDDRVARNFKSKGEVDELIAAGMELHLVARNKVTTKHSPPEDLLMANMMTSVNSYHSLNLAREVKKGMNARARTGQPNNRAPLGYYYQDAPGADLSSGRRRRRELKMHAWLPNLYNRMVDLKISRVTVPDIIRITVSEGLWPIEHKNKAYRTFVHKMLLNPIYAGRFRFAEEVHQGVFEPVITWDRWLELQDALRERGHYKKHKSPMLKDIMKCGDCGCVITHEKKIKKSGKKYYYFRCANGKGFHKTNTETALFYFTYQKVWEALKAGLCSIQIDSVLAQNISEELNKDRRLWEENLSNLLSSIDIEITGAKKKLDKILDGQLSGVIPDDVAKLKLTELSDLVRKLEANKAHQMSRNNDYEVETANSTLELVKNMKSLVNQLSEEELIELAKVMVWNLVVRGASIEINWRKPFDVLMKMGRSINWRSQGDSNPCILREREVS